MVGCCEVVSSWGLGNGPGTRRPRRFQGRNNGRPGRAPTEVGGRGADGQAGPDGRVEAVGAVALDGDGVDLAGGDQVADVIGYLLTLRGLP